MRDWNVIVTTYEHGFVGARGVLKNFGVVGKTSFFNVLAMRVEDITEFLNGLNARILEEPTLLETISQVLPAMKTFDFKTADEFDLEARRVVSQWMAQLSGQTFHIRVHRHGYERQLSSQEEERSLGEFILQELEAGGRTAQISFHDPDFLLEVVTVEHRAGLSLWSREDGKRYPFLRLWRD